MKTLRAPLLILAALFSTACGPLDAIQGTLHGVRQFLVEARASGEIVPEKADFLIVDITDAAQSVKDLKAELDAIPDGSDKRQLQVAAVRRATTKWRAIYARGHFTAVNPDVERYGRLANAAFFAVEAYYAGRAGEPLVVRAGAARPRAPKTEKQLKAEMEQAIKELEAAEKELKR